MQDSGLLKAVRLQPQQQKGLVDGLTPIAEERLSQLSVLSSHGSSLSQLSQLSQPSVVATEAASHDNLQVTEGNVVRGADNLLALQIPVRHLPVTGDNAPKRTRTTLTDVIMENPEVDNIVFDEEKGDESHPEHWFVYLICITGIPELRTNLSARRYQGDDVSANLEDELAHCNDTRNTLYQHNTLRQWHSKYKCPNAAWRYLCFVDGFTTQASAIRFMELAKYKNFLNRSRYSSMPQVAMDRMRQLTNTAGQPLMAAVRWMIEALWLTLHAERAPGAKEGRGYPPADQSCYLPNAHLRWVWLNADTCMAESMEDILQPLSHEQLSVESWVQPVEEEEEEKEREGATMEGEHGRLAHIAD